MVKLSAKVPANLHKVIAELHVVKEAKGRALKELVRYALEDKGTYAAEHPYGTDEAKSCTLEVGEKDYENSLKYRQKYTLTTRVAYFMHALEHGATLYQAEQAAAEKAEADAARAEKPQKGEPAGD